MPPSPTSMQTLGLVVLTNLMLIAELCNLNYFTGATWEWDPRDQGVEVSGVQ